MIPIQEIELKSGKNLNNTPPVVIIQEEFEEEIAQEESRVEEEIPNELSNAQIPETQQPIQPQMSNTPPYPERISIEKPIVHS